MKQKITKNLSILTFTLLVFVFTSIESTQLVYGQSGEGEKTYSENCDGCHGGGFVGWLSGAPKTGDRSKWEPILKKSMDEIVISAIKGVGRMDPKGGCDKCSDERIRSAVEYMVSKTTQ
ncbi:c-type cytochrome [bacterium]|nr:c-type cytochrome [bacterium]